VAQSTIATNVHQSLDVQVYLSSKVTLYLMFLGDGISDARNLLLIQIPNTDGLIDTRFLEDLLAERGTDSENIGQPDYYSLISW
tara:strand:+ start:27248 stop:27499 length:252 start_codon:yes stop_codon:yes gene_type:complete